MKKLLYSLLALSVIPFCGCSDDDTEETPEPVYAVLDLSTPQFVFPAAGGSRTLLVASNCDWELVNDYDWLTVSRDGDQVTITAEANTSESYRYGAVTVKAGEPGYVDKRDIRIGQPLYAENLSVGETANCYIVKTGTSYKFDATVKGNGAGAGNSGYLDTFGVKIEGAVYADLLWEATFDGDKTRSCAIIDGDPIYDGGEIYFNTGTSEGNAAIAVYNATGDILWSWHIWVTNDTIVDKENEKSVSYWMDRNLGALTTDPGDISNRGLLYQWGRKDPFLPSKAEYVVLPIHPVDETTDESNALNSQLSVLRQESNVANTQVGNGRAEWGRVAAPVVLQAPGNIDYAVKHPTTHLAPESQRYGDSDFDWYLTGGTLGLNQAAAKASLKSALWGDAESDPTNYKSIFDPCPAGYAVPSDNLFGSLDEGTYIEDVDSDWEVSDFGATWKSCQNNYFPAAGVTYFSGTPYYCSEDLCYWTNQYIDYLTKAKCLFSVRNSEVQRSKVYYGTEYYGNEYWDLESYGLRSFGANIRCVKISK